MDFDLFTKSTNMQTIIFTDHSKSKCLEHVNLLCYISNIIKKRTILFFMYYIRRSSTESGNNWDPIPDTSMATGCP